MQTHTYRNLSYFDIVNIYNILINKVKFLFHFFKILIAIKINKLLFIINMLHYFYKLYVIWSKNFAIMHTVYFCIRFTRNQFKKTSLLQYIKIMQLFKKIGCISFVYFIKKFYKFIILFLRHYSIFISYIFIYKFHAFIRML